jgi:DNA polymerase-3 subunit delta'
VRFSYPVIKKGKEEALATDFIREWMAALSENPYLSYLDWLAKMDAENKQGNIPVSECRAIMSALSLKPFESEYKILLLWLPEFLGNEGNVLLKIIEEPPQKTLFLLVAEQMDQILPTILSRTQLVRVPPIEGEDLRRALEQRFSLDAARAETLAYVSDGSYRRALELLGEVDEPLLQPFRNWLLMCFSGNKVAQNLWVAEAAGSGREEIKALLGYGLHILRMCLVFPELGEKARLGEAEQEFVSKLSRQFNPTTIEKAYKLFNDSMYQIERNGQAKLVLADLSNEMHKVFVQK